MDLYQKMMQMQKQNQKKPEKDAIIVKVTAATMKTMKT